ncbi:MAG: DUF4249 domain-containing protein [Mucilaginibacter sp.]
MMHIQKHIRLTVIGFICLAFAGCKQAFEPSLNSKITNYLVVDGIINCGNDSTTINLTRTVLLSQKQAVKVETGASLSVENDKGVFYKLTETKKGIYQCAPLNLPLSDKYRLNIKTADGKVYQSTFVEAKVTPPIDDIVYDRTADGLNISVNAHDDNNKTIYYRWSYDETWKFHADVYSEKESIGTSIINRVTQIYRCYRTEFLSRIILTSTQKLNSDVVYKRLLQFIPNRNERISEKYSINVKQYALTKEGYEFWDNQQKNTEVLGGIFDAQPSELKGNIICVSTPSEPVVGFVSVSTEARKRIFITQAQVNWEQPIRDGCGTLDTLRFRIQGVDLKIVEKYLYFKPGQSPIKIPVSEITGAFNSIEGYTAASYECADCRLRGTVNVPPFWQ